MDNGNAEKQSTGANRHFEWDVNNDDVAVLHVYCDACRHVEQCEACEDAKEIEQEWSSYDSDPYWTGGPPDEPRPEGKR